MVWLVLGLVVVLAFSNGGNDNFKGVATIYGSGSASYRRSLGWATLTTLAGSLLSFVLASRLIDVFSGRGLVPDAVAASPTFLAAVGAGSVATVLLATRFGLPVSTTHALTGALVGAGLVAASGDVDLGQLNNAILLPLAFSPFVAGGLAAALYPGARRLRRACGLSKESCVCIGEQWVPVALASGGAAVAGRQLTVTTGTVQRCQERYRGAVLGVSAQRALDAAHFLSAGAVGFARGLNDTPKIVSLILAAEVMGATAALPLVGLVVALGGIVGARRVAETMAHRVTEDLSPGRGFVANLSAAGLVAAASRYGLPVSTTHVTNGGLFGIGVVTRAARWPMIASIVAAWLTTLPLAAAVGAAAYLGLGSFA